MVDLWGQDPLGDIQPPRRTPGALSKQQSASKLLAEAHRAGRKQQELLSQLYQFVIFGLRNRERP